MEIWHSVVLGIIEGVTEFLPISSTGHLILANSLLGIPETSFLKSFDIIIQLGAICAVIILYWRAFVHWETIKKLIVAFIPTGIIGLLLYPVVKTYLLGNNTVVLWALGLGGVALILFEQWHTEPENAVADVSGISYQHAISIGLFQAIAIIPGVSRSAATIVGGLFLGLQRKVIVEFSFLLAVPTMLAASTLDLYKNYSLFSSDQLGALSLGFVVALVVALFAIKFLLRFIQTHTFTAFGIYRIVIAVLFFLVLL